MRPALRKRWGARMTPKAPEQDRSSGATQLGEVAVSILVDQAVIAANCGSQDGIEILSKLPRAELRKELKRRWKDLSRAYGG